MDSEKVALDLELGSQTKVHYKGNYQDMWGIGENVVIVYFLFGTNLKITTVIFFSC